MVDIWSAGHYGGDDRDDGTRLTRPLCFLRADPTDNGYARPIEGIRPVVDLNSMQVIRVEEYGSWPLPPEPGNYSPDRVGQLRTGIKPLLDHAARRRQLHPARAPDELAELEVRHRLQRARRA